MNYTASERYSEIYPDKYIDIDAQEKRRKAIKEFKQAFESMPIEEQRSIYFSWASNR